MRVLAVALSLVLIAGIFVDVATVVSRIRPSSFLVTLLCRSDLF